MLPVLLLIHGKNKIIKYEGMDRMVNNKKLTDIGDNDDAIKENDESKCETHQIIFASSDLKEKNKGLDDNNNEELRQIR
ncbi:unnamed protein product [Rhizophagus irregularis]|nr:unnamed protein product [Rhizophagus irregularis]